jgi:hypothetical protein
LETALIIAGIQAAVSLLQSQMQLAAAQAAAKQGQEREALLAAMQAAYVQAADTNDVLAKVLANHGISPKEQA